MDKVWEFIGRAPPESMASDNVSKGNDSFYDAASTTVPFDSSSNFDEAFAASEIPSSCLNYSIDPKATVLNDDSMILTEEKPHIQSQYSSDSPENSRDSSISPRGHKRKGSSNSDCSTASDQARPMVDAVSYQDVDVEKNPTSDFGARDSAVALNPPFNTLTLDADISAEQAMSKAFDFESASSSPSGLSRSTPMMQTVTEQSNVVPVALRPRRFFLGSREPSPARVSTQPDLDAIATSFTNTEQAGSLDFLNDGPSWDGMSGNMGWASDLTQDLVSGQDIVAPPNTVSTSVPVPMSIPVPVSVPTSLPVPAPLPVPASNSSHDNVKLYIDPISPKSRVETQINITLTLKPMPSGITKLHLPTHTISKAKLLAKSVEKSPDTLELHTMLVCTSAMEKEEVKERTLRRARGEREVSGNTDVQPANADKTADNANEHEKPTEGGEVRICQNCINRERKRAARKKPKNEDEEDRWYTYENDRVIVFNTTEYKEWQPCPFGKEAFSGLGPAALDAGNSMQIEVPMRIACYCRHQGEKIGFRVIFTIKDYQDNLVAQEWTDSILITDDHKTQVIPSNINTSIPIIDQSQIIGSAFSPMLQDDVLSTYHRRPYYSTTDLQSLQGTQTRFLPQTTYARMPRSQTRSSAEPSGQYNRSREASPSAQMGPKKKRKSSPSPHRKLPASLAMTPRVDTFHNHRVARLPTAIVTNQGQFAPGPSSLQNPNLPVAMSPFSIYPAVLMVANPAQVTSEPSTPIAQVNAGGYNFENGYYPYHADQIFISQSHDRLSRTMPPTPTGTIVGGFPHRSASVSNLPQQMYFADMNAQQHV